MALRPVSDNAKEVVVRLSYAASVGFAGGFETREVQLGTSQAIHNATELHCQRRNTARVLQRRHVLWVVLYVNGRNGSRGTPSDQ